MFKPDKSRYLYLVVALLLFSSFLLSKNVFAVSSQADISTSGTISYPSFDNLAVIPDDWTIIYGSNPQYSYLDYSVYRTQGVSIRVEPDYVGVREVNGNWYAVQAGDHVYASCWMKTESGDSNPYKGARVGIDLYGVADGRSYIIDSYPHNGDEHLYSMVPWGTSDWSQRVWSFDIPSTPYTTTTSGQQIPATYVTSIVMWMQVIDYTASGNAWFADAELYITP